MILHRVQATDMPNKQGPTPDSNFAANPLAAFTIDLKSLRVDASMHHLLDRRANPSSAARRQSIQ
jgi:hypothetical protein